MAIHPDDIGTINSLTQDHGLVRVLEIVLREAEAQGMLFSEAENAFRAAARLVFE